MISATLCSDFETKGLIYHELHGTHACVKTGGAVVGTNEDIVNHVTRIGVVTILVPNSLVF